MKVMRAENLQAMADPLGLFCGKTATEEQIVMAGAVIYIPANEAHSHGATEDLAFAHLSVQTRGRPR